MKFIQRLTLFLAFSGFVFNLSAQNYKSDRLRTAVEIVGIQVMSDSILPEKTYELKAKDGRTICLRTNPMGEIEHVGIPLFNDVLRLLQPWPVYDFLEFAVLNWKYKINPNRLYLSKVIFKRGSWDVLLTEELNRCECSIENQDDELYVVTWKREDKDVAVIEIPIEYELLNNDTRRNMEREFIRELTDCNPIITRCEPAVVDEADLSIYGTEGLFAVPGSSYIIDLLNQNTYYKLTTVVETADTIINNQQVTMSMEAVIPVVVRDTAFPAESFANLMMCDDASVPDVTMDLDFHLSNYHRERVSLPLSQLRAFCHQQGCKLFYAYNGMENSKVRGVLFASNLPKGYNHLFSIRVPVERLTSAAPTVHADVYLYIPPVDKEKLFGTAPTRKSGAKFKLP